MSREKLTETLRAKGELRARQIWAEAEQRAADYRRAAEARCNEQQRTEQARLTHQLDRQLDRLHGRTDRQLRRIRLGAEETLAQRLRQLALAELATLPDAQRRVVLQQLAGQLPALDWRQVSVDPRDRELAAELFPGCTCTADPALSGGLVVTNDDGIRIDDSLTGRLDRVWPQLCGRLLEALHSTSEVRDAAAVD